MSRTSSDEEKWESGSMIPPGADDERGDAMAGRPQPPYSPDVLADFHAGVLPPDVADEVWSAINDDPDAQAVLRALDRTTADLRAMPLPATPMPSSVAALTRATLDQIDDETAGTGSVTSIDRGRHQRRRRWMLAGGGVAAAAVAVLAFSVGTLRPTDTDADPDMGTPVAAPAEHHLDAGEKMSALTVLGHDDFAPFPTEAALRRCTAANGVPDSTTVLGSGPITLRGGDAVVILLSTGVAGRFDALVVGPDCAVGRPSTISRTLIGG
ncbi:hypothetical protein AAFP35_04375 [Gordonia sp. CPCC 206044]|uniref:hypothetical protein n=1 Tax=Gordonia sp. CPCC 206044 TaxID=3140793 RepID=UPI003AF3EB8F